ncbi:uncharacterized protein LOC109544118 [Dendroctonus ponderosae]|uniref:uncharacterized protein LOC109544118 n=1 Tax=Dendroctonus ponderosae TaxID=77166 RepID=UPI002034C77C|nr:uncharacterized protein LOC109544118 [Dendroctonus ponderosae]KAH1027703.1 hypothetical protein HUJ05_001160 [Dendroctonus ponderosae]KAH1027704.1 hypothetical protein HUJ05_001160 [Dendroctonus ponderosae]
MDVKTPSNKIKETKPQKKKAPAPVIRHTITSYKRMMKANPLLELEMKGINVNEYFNQLAAGNRTNPPPTASIPVKQERFEKPQLRLPMASTTGLSKQVTSAKSKPSTINSQTHQAARSVTHSSKVLLNSKPLPKSSMKPKTCTYQLTGNSSIQPHSEIQNKATQTKENCLPSKVPAIVEPIEEVPPSVSPTDRRRSNSFTFNTPQTYKRRSVAFLTPQSVRKQSFFRASTPAPVDMKKLQDRLNIWLKTRAKPPVLFKNMRLFGIDEERKLSSSFKNPIIEENKENAEVNESKSNSYENLGIQRNANIDDAQDLNQGDLSKYAKEAMGELLTLIEEEYPRNQCLAWLELIKKKYDKADNEPEYWECRAAIEQSAGNIQNAVQFYEAAIINGAEVNSINKSLDQLLKKFSLLNISQTELEPKERVSSDRGRIVKEARNIFKSTIINFAVGVRNSKKNNSAGNTEATLFITPVKRSTRISRGGYANTPGLRLCDSLKDLDLNSEEFQFKKNDALV